MAERKDFISKDEFPSNSFKGKEQKKVVKKVKIEGGVKHKKKSLGKRVAGTIFDDDTTSVGQYILWDVLIPAFKSTLSDIVTGGIEMLLYGDGGGDDRRRKRDRGRSYVSYGSYYDDRDRDDRKRRREKGKRARHEFDDVIFDSRRDAENVLTQMIDLLEEYDEIAVSDFYDMVGMDSTYTDQSWGWTNLKGSYVERGRDGYYIKLPRAVVLDGVPWN